jgi:hypothetical protein
MGLVHLQDRASRIADIRDWVPCSGRHVDIGPSYQPAPCHLRSPRNHPHVMVRGKMRCSGGCPVRPVTDQCHDEVAESPQRLLVDTRTSRHLRPGQLINLSRVDGIQTLQRLAAAHRRHLALPIEGNCCLFQTGRTDQPAYRAQSPSPAILRHAGLVVPALPHTQEAPLFLVSLGVMTGHVGPSGVCDLRRRDVRFRRLLAGGCRARESCSRCLPRGAAWPGPSASRGARRRSPDPPGGVPRTGLVSHLVHSWLPFRTR